MNYPILFRLLSLILVALAVAFATSTGIGLVYGEHQRDPSSFYGFLLSVGITVLLALAFRFLGRRAGDRLFRKDAFALIGLGWILACLLGALPYLLLLPGVKPIDAVFESVSGLTTTGSTVFTDFESWPRSLLFWRCMSQWIGGLGVVVFFVAVLGSFGASGKILFTHESTSSSTDLETGRIQSGVMLLTRFYLGISALCLVAYRFCGLDWFDSACHMFTTVATGGFSTRSASIEAFQNPLLEWVATTFMALGATTFLVLIHLLRRNPAPLRKNSEIPVFYGILILASLFLAAELMAQGTPDGWRHAFRLAAFNATSILTTTGYSSTDFNLWTHSAHMVLLLLMISGGCSGSTAGGLKVIRVVFVFRLAIRNTERAFRPNVIRPFRLNGHVVSSDVEQQNAGYVLLALLLFALSTLALAVIQPDLSFPSVVSIGISCFFNIGPGLDQIGPAANFGFLEAETKVVLCFLMLLGRLELYAVLVLFFPTLWKRFF